MTNVEAAPNALQTRRDAMQRARARAQQMPQKSGTLLVIIPSAVAENIFNRRNCSVARLNLQRQISMGEAENPRFLCRRATLLSDAKLLAGALC